MCANPTTRNDPCVTKDVLSQETGLRKHEACETVSSRFRLGVFVVFAVLGLGVQISEASPEILNPAA